MSVADTPGLLEEARRGDNEACTRLIEENAGLIWSIVRRYYGRGRSRRICTSWGAWGS